MADNLLIRAAVLGGAAGARSVTPIAALAAQGRSGWVRGLTTAAAVGEIVMDKLPGTPSRLKPAPLGGRILLGALAGGGQARSRGANVVLQAITGAVAAAAVSYAGAAWRASAARRGLGFPAALAEDAVAIMLASAAAQRRR